MKTICALNTCGITFDRSKRRTKPYCCAAHNRTDYKRKIRAEKSANAASKYQPFTSNTVTCQIDGIVFLVDLTFKGSKPRKSYACQGCNEIYNTIRAMRRVAYDTKEITLADRFWAKVNKNGSVQPHCVELGNCWEWAGAKKSQRGGYGSFEKSIAHRVSWEMHNGKIPNSGANWVLHKCDNPSCVRPDHLFLGTPKDNSQDNSQDMISKGRDRYDGTSGLSRLSRARLE